MDVKYVWI